MTGQILLPASNYLVKQNIASRWRSFRRTPSTRLPRCWRAWLLDKGSLTQHLIRASRGDFSVEVLFQGWSTATLSETQALNLPPRQMVLVREVRLMGRGEPWVYARSIIPQHTLTGPQRALRRLGNRPLGELLFKSPNMRRGAIETTLLTVNTAKKKAWARRSLFYLNGKPLLVSEVFLPELQRVQYRPTLGY
jgi:chorismate--pyruvate lyase